jgi:hypothetical protein
VWLWALRPGRIGAILRLRGGTGTSRPLGGPGLDPGHAEAAFRQRRPCIDGPASTARHRPPGSTSRFPGATADPPCRLHGWPADAVDPAFCWSRWARRAPEANSLGPTRPGCGDSAGGLLRQEPSRSPPGSWGGCAACSLRGVAETTGAWTPLEGWDRRAAPIPASVAAGWRSKGNRRAGLAARAQPDSIPAQPVKTCSGRSGPRVGLSLRPGGSGPVPLLGSLGRASIRVREGGLTAIVLAPRARRAFCRPADRRLAPGQGAESARLGPAPLPVPQRRNAP